MLSEAPTLETDRLILRHFVKSDVDALVQELMSNPEVMATLPESPNSIEEYDICAHEYIHEYSSLWSREGYGGWAVCLQSTEANASMPLIGFCGLTPEQFKDGGPELAYGYGIEHWGKGYGNEAARACMDWAFSTGGLNRLSVCHYSGNAASKRIIENMGYSYLEDKDLWDSVEKGRGLMPTYSLDCKTYLNS